MLTGVLTWCRSRLDQGIGAREVDPHVRAERYADGHQLIASSAGGCKLVRLCCFVIFPLAALFAGLYVALIT